MYRIRWMLVLACCGCGGSQVPVGPREAPVALWSERWDNGRAKREYQYYLDAWGAIVRHGYYREYSRFVDRLLTVEERYIAGTRVGPRYARCGAMAPPLDYANGDFEFGSFDGWSLEGARANSIRLVTDAGRGRFSAKLTLQPGDMVRGGNRVELVRRDSADYLGERIYSWSFKIDAGYEEEPYWQTICQFHNQPDGALGEDWDNYPVYFPPLSILYADGVCKVKLYTLDQTPHIIGTFPVRKGAWFDIYFQIKWSLGGDGYVEMYADDEPVTPFNGTDYKFYSPNVYNAFGNYLKVGLYRDSRAVEVNAVYVDNLILYSMSYCPNRLD